MLDIVEIPDGEDLLIMDTVVSKAANIVSVQLGSLEYAPDFGVDLTFFLESEFQFQNESFKAYLVQRLAESQVNVSQVISTVNTLFDKYTHYVGDIKKNSGGLII